SSAQGSGHLKLIANSGPVLVQAQADTMTLAAKEQLKMVSVSGKLDLASAKKIHLAVAGGSAITIEGGNITVQCPGVLTVHASQRSFVGGAKVDAALPVMSNSNSSWVQLEAHYEDAWNTPWPLENTEVKVNSKTITKSLTINKA
ncbi:DUF2345 domain-containing protein, partial [Uliginosibacterium sp. TH139]|uniref:DUF2345 domain-containing protein n=1 Tax=Uliginosibacterium sp. TH139 TaxID=2067453 RepID=UPI000CC543BC